MFFAYHVKIVLDYKCLTSCNSLSVALLKYRVTCLVTIGGHSFIICSSYVHIDDSSNEDK